MCCVKQVAPILWSINIGRIAEEMLCIYTRMFYWFGNLLVSCVQMTQLLMCNHNHKTRLAWSFDMCLDIESSWYKKGKSKKDTRLFGLVNSAREWCSYIVQWSHRVIQSNRKINLSGQMQTLLIPPNQIYKFWQWKKSAKHCSVI